MAIKISGTTVIGDDKNLISTGIATIGSGSSVTTIDGVSGVVNVGAGATINAVSGDINTIGIVTVGQLSVPVQVSSFNPAIGATNASPYGNIVITFSQTVGLGSTGFIEIKAGSATTGTSVETFTPSSSGIALTVGGTTLQINTFLDYNQTFFPIMSSGFVTANGSDFVGINTVGSGVTYSFSTPQINLGDAFEGGFLICQSGGVRWIVAPSSTEVTRCWNSRNDAVTTANANAACGDWFVPTSGQLSNPGFTCRTYWDTYTTRYWSGTCQNVNLARGVNFSSGSGFTCLKTCICPVRAFRCMSY